MSNEHKSSSSLLVILAIDSITCFNFSGIFKATFKIVNLFPFLIDCNSIHTSKSLSIITGCYHIFFVLIFVLLKSPYTCQGNHIHPFLFWL